MKYAIVLILSSIPLAYLTASSVWAMFRPVTISALEQAGSQGTLVPSDELTQSLQAAYQEADARSRSVQELANQLQAFSEAELLLSPPSALQPVSDPVIAKAQDDWKLAQSARDFQRHYQASVDSGKKKSPSEPTKEELEARKKRLSEFKAKKNDYAPKLPLTAPLFDGLDAQIASIDKSLNALALKEATSGKWETIQRLFNSGEFSKCKSDITALKTYLRENGVEEGDGAISTDVRTLEKRLSHCLEMQAIIDQPLKAQQLDAVTNFLKLNSSTTDEPEPEAGLYAKLTKLRKDLDRDRTVKKILAHDDIELLLVQGAALLEDNAADVELRQELRQQVLKRLGDEKGLRELQAGRVQSLANEQEAVVERGPLFGQFLLGMNSFSYWKYDPATLAQRKIANPLGDLQIGKNDFLIPPRRPTPLRLQEEYSRQRDILIQANSTKQQWLDFADACVTWDRDLKELRDRWPPNEEPVVSATGWEFASQKRFAEKITQHWDKFSKIVSLTP